MPTPARFAVFGHPIAHSQSPRLHALFAGQFGIALDYTTIDATPDAFAAAVRRFFAAGGRGANVTLPHKPTAFTLATQATATARRLGVANVLTPLPDGNLEADSNDGAGMLADLRASAGLEPRGHDVLLLGAGGAARAAAFALLDAGATRLTIANRTFARAEALVTALDARDRARSVAWDTLAKLPASALVINATSAGVQHARMELPSTLVDARSVAYDLSYGPAAQPFVDWAKAQGCARAHDGLGMLVETAAASFARWHGVRPDTAAALRLLRAG
ncbi:MAG TPA: shikimate dehydrogenase [Rhodanobacteraceae bacterium]|nr:shikimate dehydrogenase [Rhodanobacteraceae bacterium]